MTKHKLRKVPETEKRCVFQIHSGTAMPGGVGVHEHHAHDNINQH
jgi:hypothetical protein